MERKRVQIRGHETDGEKHHGRGGMRDETKPHDSWNRLENRYGYMRTDSKHGTRVNQDKLTV